MLAIVLPIIFILLLAGLIVFLVWFCCYRDGAKKGSSEKVAPAKTAAVAADPKAATTVTTAASPESPGQKRSRELQEKNERARLDRERLEANAVAGQSAGSPSTPQVASGERHAATFGGCTSHARAPLPALPPHLRKDPKSKLAGIKPSDAGRTMRGADTSGKRKQI